VSPPARLASRHLRSLAEGTGIKIIDGIGSTEMLQIFISARQDIRPGATGKSSGYRAKVVDEAQ